jgi:hypothetical protein
VNFTPDYSRFTDILRTWSELHAGAQRIAPSWDSAQLLLRSADGLDEYARQHLQDAAARSDTELSPLGEPLALNLGEHRWLSMGREESYSDWLAWILQGMSGPVEILPLFGFDDQAISVALEQVESVRREDWSEHGRTDIEVRFGKRGCLLIEVKVQSPSREVYSQLKRYTERVAREHVDRELLVLLGTEAPELSIAPFEFIDWQTLCQRLRRYARHLKTSNLLRAAAILIFCGAVEQNLFGLSMHPKRFRAIATVDYLRSWRGEA